MDFRSVLYGLALGDALGWPVEFMKLPEIRAKFGMRGIQEPPDPALYTDDTQMTLALAEGILDAGPEAPIDVIMTAVGKRFITWLHSPENTKAPGNTCIAGVQNYEAGAPWRTSGIEASKGSGTAMRAAGIGLLYQHDEARLREVAVASSLITHRHPAAIAASVGAAYLLKLALDGAPVESYMRAVMDITDGLSEEFDLAILRVGHVLGWTDELGALNHIGQGWVGEEAVAMALYCVLRAPDDYVRAVRLAVNIYGDSDTVACIVGGIMGARLGLDAIPAEWRARCEKAAYLDDLAQRLDAARR